MSNCIDLSQQRRIRKGVIVPNGDEQRILNLLMNYHHTIKYLHKGNLYFGEVTHSTFDPKEGTVTSFVLDTSGKTFEVDFNLRHLVSQLLGHKSDFIEKPGRLYFPLSCLKDTNVYVKTGE